MSDLIPARIPRHLLVDALFGSPRRRTDATDEILEILADAASGFPLDDVDEVCESCKERIEGKEPEPSIVITAIHYDNNDPECPFCTTDSKETSMYDDEDYYYDDWYEDEEEDDCDCEYCTDGLTGFGRFNSVASQEERDAAVDSLLR